MTVPKWLLSFSHRLAWSIVFGLAGFFPCVMPTDDGPLRVVYHSMCYVFDLPVALVTRLGIPYVAGLDVFWFRGVGEFTHPNEMLYWHMRVAVPTYLALLYLPNLAIAVHRRLKTQTDHVSKSAA